MSRSSAPVMVCVMPGNYRPPANGSRRTAWLAAAAVAGLYLIPLAGHPPAVNPNELVRIELALALADGPTVDLAEQAKTYGLSEDVARHQGRILADKAPGLSMAAAPIVRLAEPVVPSIPGTKDPSYWALRHLLTALLVAGTTAGICFLLVNAFKISR